MPLNNLSQRGRDYIHELELDVEKFIQKKYIEQVNKFVKEIQAFVQQSSDKKSDDPK